MPDFNSANNKFPRTEAIMGNLNGPKFVPNGSVKLRDAVVKVGRAKIENWTGRESDETTWHDVSGNETSALTMWREAVIWFQQELFAGNIVASLLKKNGTLVSVARETFGQDDVEHIFREQQEQAWVIFVDAIELETLLTKNFSKIEKQSKKIVGQKSPLLISTLSILKKLWPDGPPIGLKSKERNKQVLAEAEKTGVSKPSDRTITRALAMFEHRAK